MNPEAMREEARQASKLAREALSCAAVRFVGIYPKANQAGVTKDKKRASVWTGERSLVFERAQ